MPHSKISEGIKRHSMFANAAARNETGGGAGRASGAALCINATPSTGGEIGESIASATGPQKLSESVRSRTGPHTVGSGDRRGALRGRPPLRGGAETRRVEARGEPSPSPLFFLISWARIFNSSPESPRLSRAKGATPGKDHALSNPPAERESPHARRGRRASRWGTRTRSRKTVSIIAILC